MVRRNLPRESGLREASVNGLIQPFGVSAVFDGLSRNVDEDKLIFRSYILVDVRTLYNHQKSYIQIESCASNDSIK